MDAEAEVEYRNENPNHIFLDREMDIYLNFTAKNPDHRIWRGAHYVSASKVQEIKKRPGMKRFIEEQEKRMKKEEEIIEAKFRPVGDDSAETTPSTLLICIALAASLLMAIVTYWLFGAVGGGAVISMIMAIFVGAGLFFALTKGEQIFDRLEGTFEKKGTVNGDPK